MQPILGHLTCITAKNRAIPELKGIIGHHNHTEDGIETCANNLDICASITAEHGTISKVFGASAFSRHCISESL